MNSGKEHIGRMASMMARKGIQHVVVSPGSRNAPVIILFAQNGNMILTSVTDERSAGFFAIGMALHLGLPVALLCTSGSAAINYGPAISEAFYQKVPLLVITADRPSAWVDQGDGQTIRQENLFSNFIRKSYNLPEYIYSAEKQWQFDRMVNEAIDYTRFPVPGPVHLNLPLSEPLYDIQGTDASPDVRIAGMAPVFSRLDTAAMNSLTCLWNTSPRKMILVGQMSPGNPAGPLVARLSGDPSVIVLTETTSNLSGERYIGCIDRVIEGLSGGDRDYVPEILLTFGGAVVSKKIKSLLRQMKPVHHWNVNPDTTEFHVDTYQSLTLTIPLSPEVFLGDLAQGATPVQSTYRQLWLQRNADRQKKHEHYLNSTGFCDLKVYETLFQHIPEGSHVHLGNSTPVRYAQLFEQTRNFRFWSNRGTSGIDGSTSTAAGHAHVCKEPVTLITGDIAFFYDSNALWNQNLSGDFRIILINNGGGNIFRILPGPSQFAELEPYLETAHTFRAKGLTENFGLDYFSAENQEQLTAVLPEFFAETGKPALLEIVTPPVESAVAVRNYLKFMIQ